MNAHGCDIERHDSNNKRYIAQGQPIPVARKNLRIIVSEWLARGMRHSGLSQTALADKAGVSRATVNRLVQQKQDAEQPTIKRLAKAMKYPFPDFDVAFPDPVDSSAKRYAMVSGGRYDERSGPAGVLVRERVVPAVQGGLLAWLELGRDMQHNLAVKVIKEALEAQDFAGSPVLRALHGIAEKMSEMGYTAMSRHIWAEMGKYFGHQLPPDEQP